MKLIVEKNIYICQCTYSEKDIAKDAGFRWNPKEKKWWTSSFESAYKLFKYAEDDTKKIMNKSVEERKQNIEKSYKEDIQKDFPHPVNLQYLNYQKAGIDYALDKKYTLIADEMGCIEGNGNVEVSTKKGRGGNWTIKELYERFHGIRQYTIGKNNRIYPLIVGKDNEFFLRQLDEKENRFTNGRIKNVILKGKRKVCKIKTNFGKELILTPDHELLSEYGWKEIQKIKIGDNINVNGNIIIDKNCAHKKCVYRYIDGDGYVRLRSPLLWKHYRYGTQGVLEHIYLMEKRIGRKINKGEQIHHKNGIKNDNRLENLELLTISQHNIIHKKYKHFGKVIKKGNKEIVCEPKLEKIVYFKLLKKEIEVYDIVMEEPNRNFLVNKIVVHNCGKTIQAIGILNVLSVKNQIKVQVVCPAGLKINWRLELEKWLVYKGNVSYSIISYDMLKKEIDKIGILNVVIFDESHYNKNGKAQRAKASMLLSEKSEKVLFLTGTPILNRPVELFTTLQMAKHDLGSNWYKYVMRYCGGYRDNWGLKSDGASNLEELQEKLRATFMIRRMKKDVLKELPDKRRQLIILEENKKIKDFLKQEKEMIKDLKSIKKSSSITKEMQNKYNIEASKLKSDQTFEFSIMAKIRHLTALAKIDSIIEAIEEMLENENKIVIFAHHRDVIDLIYDHFQNISVRLYGGMTDKEKQKSIDDFQNNNKIKLFIGGIKASGVGITLTASSTVIFAELDWTPGNVCQCEDRLHRIGQKDSVMIYHYVIDNSIEAKILKVILEKQEIIDKALNKQDDTSISLFSILDTL